MAKRKFIAHSMWNAKGAIFFSHFRIKCKRESERKGIEATQTTKEIHMHHSNAHSPTTINFSYCVLLFVLMQQTFYALYSIELMVFSSFFFSIFFSIRFLHSVQNKDSYTIMNYIWFYSQNFSLVSSLSLAHTRIYCVLGTIFCFVSCVFFHFKCRKCEYIQKQKRFAFIGSFIERYITSTYKNTNKIIKTQSEQIL